MQEKRAHISNLWQRISLHDDDKAFESFFHLLNMPLIRFCIMYIHQKEAAEEIVSDVFAKCWVQRKSLADVQNPETYLFVAVKNQSLNYLKKYSQIHVVRIEDTSEIKLARTFNPQEELEKKEILFKMEQAIGTLPQQCRIIFRLVKEDGLRYKEVAKILGISPRTVQTQLFRAMKKLSTVLAGHFAGGAHREDSSGTGTQDNSPTATVLTIATTLLSITFLGALLAGVSARIHPADIAQVFFQGL